MLALLMLFALSQCKRDEPIALTTPGKFYHKYTRGQISECWMVGTMYYVAGDLAYDSGATIYDRSGNSVASCNYAWGRVYAMCNRMDSCRVIYRSEGNMHNLPFVDIYGLSKIK
ncbi:hypothetical protein AEM51_01210 [Bacteroidetes bacterium UKL13-3]|jgi:hypothetical protein|nr:hypothetical protein AEM51_01210 [Bacteroidetes bacterium UKL13-3]HCP92674.1 hypothetical protein [Bacteroidota bacterium]